MTYRITAVDRIDDAPALEALLREYLQTQVDAFEDASGQAGDVEPLIAATMGNLAAYAPPDGRTFLVHGLSDRLVGTIFLKKIGPNLCEIKRLYVRPEARGAGLGRKLTEAAMGAARDMGFARMVLDTGRWLTTAQTMYQSMGFSFIDPYPECETPEVVMPYLVYMGRDL